MTFPTSASVRSLYIRRDDGTYGYAKGRELHSGYPIECIKGRFESDPTKERTIYYIKRKCQQAIDCIATVEYRVLEPGEYYTPEMLWEWVEDLEARQTGSTSGVVGDSNGDGVVTIADFFIFADIFEKTLGD